MRRVASWAFLVLLLVSTFVLAVGVRLVRAQANETVYINSDGSITPSTALVSTVDNVTYTLNGQVGELVVERDNIVIDGDSNWLGGLTLKNALVLSSVTNVTVENTQMFSHGEYNPSHTWLAAPSANIFYSTDIRLIGNNFMIDVFGINIEYSNDTIVSGNNIYVFGASVPAGVDTSQWEGITMGYSSGNVVSDNNITNCGVGIYLQSSSGNSFYHNNFIDNNLQVNSNNSTNTWDNGYPSGGNYWSDYQTRYPGAVETDSSGIWGTPYVIDANNTDNYPLIGWYPSLTVPETVYINSDGSVSPSSAPISTVDNVTYAFTGNVNYPAYNGVVVERSNIVVDGNGHTVQGNVQEPYGIISVNGLTLTGLSNVTVEDVNVTGFEYSVYLNDSSGCRLSGNKIVGNSVGNSIVLGNGISLTGGSSNNTVDDNSVAGSNQFGIYLDESSFNTVVGDNVTAARSTGIGLEGSDNNTINSNRLWLNFEGGIFLDSSSNNTISGNNVTANIGYGIWLNLSSGNWIYHNDFVNNTVVQALSDGMLNTWDNGYPSGGNYWSDYNGMDFFSGPYQNVTGSDGIGDTPYTVAANNTDHYPLMGVFSDFSVAEGVDVHVVSNSTVSGFGFNGTAVLFNVTGVSGTTGFCNVRVPTALVNGTLAVFVNGTQVQYTLLPGSNSGYSYLYFTYGHSTEQVVIVPELADSFILAVFMLTALLAVAVCRKRCIRS